MKEITYIKEGNQRTHAVVPIDLFKRLMGAAEELSDRVLYDAAKKSDDGFHIPADVLNRELDGDHPVRAWREYRGLTVDSLATTAGISKAYLSQIENGKRHGTTRVMKALSSALGVPLDILAEQEELKKVA